MYKRQHQGDLGDPVEEDYLAEDHLEAEAHLKAEEVEDRQELT